MTKAGWKRRRKGGAATKMAIAEKLCTKCADWQ
jgi:hypothetical protein